MIYNETICCISGDLNVVIQPSITTGSGYRVGNSLQLVCQVQAGQVEPVGSIEYSWSSTCSGECFVSGQTTPSVTRDLLRAVDAGSHTCAVTDTIGNYGSAVIDIQITGVCAEVFMWFLSLSYQ